MDIHLKFFILSRPEDWIKGAFCGVAGSSLQEFALHDVAEYDHEPRYWLFSKLLD